MGPFHPQVMEEGTGPDIKENHMSGNRMGRINEEIQRELSALIPTVKDPRVTGLISATAVDTTADL